MIAKGTPHNNGAKLADYLITGKENERAKLHELRGFASDDIREAFRSVHVMAASLPQLEQPFFHVQVRNPEGETLTREQWVQVADRIEAKLGLNDQPRAIAFHRNEETGHEHMHLAWSRIDSDTMTARALPFYKLRLKEICRDLEAELGLTRVTSERPGQTMAPLRYEHEQARRLGVDIHAVRENIRDCWDHSDNGRSFSAALADKGLVLARGERRGFIVIDNAGGMHALGKRILGHSAEDVRVRLSDIERQKLPTVEQARAQLGHSTRSASLDEIARAEAIKARDAGAMLESITRQRATFTGRDLEWAVKKQIDSEAERRQFTDKILTHPDVVRLADDASTPRYTTKAVLASEGQVLNSALELAKSDRHEAAIAARVSVLKRDKYENISREQVRALRHATGAEGLALIDGQAGTGKSYTMSAIREVYEEQGYRVIGLAPTNAVAQDMKEDGFSRARTIHSELYTLDNGKSKWDGRTVVMIDEAAMIDTRNMGRLTAHASATGAKLILIGDERQLSSIERGGMFGFLKDRCGAAELTEVRRQQADEDRLAAMLMAKGNYREALARYQDKGGISWTATQSEAADTLISQWAKDHAADPSKSRFVFAYTNHDVNELNHAIRRIRAQTGELGPSASFETKHGQAEFAQNDRVQFTGNDKQRGIYNGQAGTVQSIEGDTVTVMLDGKRKRIVEFDAREFQEFRHGYAGTIYKGQGRTIDQTYLFHSEHWRSAASYVALTRHSQQTQLFVSRDTAADLRELSWQMARIDDRRAASHFLEAPRELDRDQRGLSVEETIAILAEPKPKAEERITKHDQPDAADKIDWSRYLNDPAYRRQLIERQEQQQREQRPQDRHRGGGLER